jgi:WD40 repeat protein
MAKWAKDTATFLKQNWHRLQNDPISVYHLFAFTPKSTIFQTIYTKSKSFPHPIVTMGLEDEWPGKLSIATHEIRTACLSECGNWFATGGKDADFAVYGLWDVGLADGETHIHPCGTLGCKVENLAFYGDESSLCLQTLCDCGSLCLWNPSTQPHTLLDQIRLDSPTEYVVWSRNGVKKVKRYLYYLWVREEPEQYHQLHEGEEWRWTFSPKDGSKLAGQSEDILEVWDCGTLQRIFNKRCIDKITRCVFSPDAKTIVIRFERLTECVSTEDGTTIWTVPFGGSIYFFSHGQKIVIWYLSVYIVNAVDGSILGDAYVPGQDFYIHPENERMAIITDFRNFYSWDLSDMSRMGEVGKAFLNLEVMASSVYVSWPHRALLYPGYSTIFLHSLQSTRSENEQLNLSFVRFDLSPNGEYLVIFTTRREIQIWDTKSGNRVMAHDHSPVNYDSLKVKFFRESSFLLLWCQSYMALMDIISRKTKLFDVIEVAFADFLNRSTPPSILTIGKDGSIETLSFCGTLRTQISHLSFCPLSGYLAISPDDSLLVVSGIGDHGQLIIKHLSPNGQEVHWPTAGCTGVIFSLDGNGLILAENLQFDWGNEFCGVFHLELPGMTVRSSCLLSIRSHQEIIRRYSTHILDNMQWDQGQLVRNSFDSDSGNMTISPILFCDDHIRIRYGRQFLADSLWYQRSKKEEGWYFKSTGNFITWKNSGQPVIIADMSLLISHA